MIARRRRVFGRWLADTSGGVAIAVGLAGPAVALAVGASLEYASLSARHAELQRAADAAALAATQQMRLSRSRDTVGGVAQAVVVDLASPPAGNAQSVRTVVDDRAMSVETEIQETVRTVFGRLLNAPTMTIRVRATAQAVGQSKICVIALNPQKSGSVMLDGAAKLTGMDCVVQSNSVDAKGIASKSGSLLKAVQLCSAGGFEGGAANFSGERVSDCPRQPDPLASRAPPPTGGCTHSTKLVITTSITLFPGVFCEGIEIKAGAKVQLAPGTYVVKDGSLKVDDDSVLTGKNVAFYFQGANATFDFLSRAVVDLSAPRDGNLAGILVVGDRNAPDTREYKITSDYARNLLGTIYLPRGYLTVDAKAPVADQSAYTAIIADRIELKQSPNLVLNTRYDATDVPVPTGLAPTGKPRLIR